MPTVTGDLVQVGFYPPLQNAVNFTWLSDTAYTAPSQAAANVSFQQPAVVSFVPPVPLWSNVSLLISGRGPADTLGMSDESVHNHAVFLGGNTVIKSTVAKFGTTSIYLDGSGDYLYTPPSASFEFKYLDFSVETWIWPTAATFGGPGAVLFDFRPGSTNGFFPMVYFEGQKIVYYVNAVGRIVVDHNLSAGEWNHVAVCRHRGVLRLFLNGRRVGPPLVDLDNYTGLSRPAIGVNGFTPTQNYLQGYLCDFRVVRGQGIYSENFTPPAAALPVPVMPTENPLWGNTVLSMTLNGADGEPMQANLDAKGNTFINQSGTPITSRSWGGATGDSCLYFNASTRIQSSGNIPGLNFGTGDFEISLWAYQAGYHASSPACLLNFNADSPAQGWRLWITRVTGEVNFMFTGYPTLTTAAGVTTLGRSDHIMVNRVSGQTSIWVNGKLEATTALLTGCTAYSSYLQISGALTANWLYNGYLDRIEVLAGAVRHREAFVPEVTPLIGNAGTISGTVRDDTNALCARTVRAYRRDTGALVKSTTSALGDPSIGSVKLLIHGTGPVGSTTVLDSSLVPKTITLAGGAAISNFTSNFGDTALRFSASGQSGTIPASADFAFGMDDFTVEFLYYNQNVAAGNCAALCNMSAFAAAGWHIDTYPNVLYFGNASNGITLGILTPANQWMHIAFSRVDGLLSGFKDGLLVGTVLMNTNFTETPLFCIGKLGWMPAVFVGLLDEIRITKGVGRYQRNFTPFSIRFPTVDGSLSLGTYSIACQSYAEHSVLFLDDDAGTAYNAIGYDRVLPV